MTRTAPAIVALQNRNPDFEDMLRANHLTLEKVIDRRHSVDWFHSLIRIEGRRYQQEAYDAFESVSHILLPSDQTEARLRITMDIYDQLEQLVPQERKEDFLRLSRQLKEYGDHNPELLRIVEAMGFLSLYTEQLLQRVSDAIEHAQAQLATDLKVLHAEHLSALRAFNINQDRTRPSDAALFHGQHNR